MAFTSLLTGATGLRVNQQTLDVVGNNLANSNTTGFKAQRQLFADLLYQTLAGATAPSATNGGTNPIQLGFGVKVASIDNVLTQGVLDPTGRDFDAAIQGQGFFEVSDGTRTFFTRAGTFNVNGQGFLVEAGTGFFVLRGGTVGDPTATQQGFQVANDARLRVPLGAGTPGSPTANVSVLGNLDATAAVGATVNSSVEAIDSQGARHVLSLTFTKAAANRWTLAGSLPSSEGSLTDAAVGPIDFDATGVPSSFNGDLTMTAAFNGIATAQTISFNLGVIGQSSGITQFGRASEIRNVTQDGVEAGVLSTVSIGKDGTISGIFTNSRVIPLARLAVARFRNPQGLTREGSNLFSVSASSGEPEVGPGQDGGRGSVEGGSLETSNVDVVREFAALIVAQRGFQVNARGITVSDQVLSELADIIR